MTGIYDGVRVLELAGTKASFCGKMLASFGAEVIKIEPPEGHPSRYIGPFAEGKSGPDASLSFAYNNTGKKSAVLNLCQSEGKKAFMKLAETADIILEDMEPGRMGELGIGYEAIHSINPGIIMCSVTPFGQDGPHAHWQASSDLIVDAMGGCMAEVGYEGKGPLHIGYDIQSTGVCGYACIAIQAAYHNRLFTGKGTYIDVSQQEAVAMWRTQQLGRSQSSQKNRSYYPSKDFVPHGVVTCKDGFASLMYGSRWFELLDWMDDEGIDTSVLCSPKYKVYADDMLLRWDRYLLDKINEIGAKYTKTAFMEEAQRRRVPTGSMESPDTLLENRQLNERGFYVEVDHPVIGRYRYPGFQGLMEKSPVPADKSAPLLDADTYHVMRDVGYSDEELSELRKAGIIGRK